MKYWGLFGFTAALFCAGCAAQEGSGEGVTSTVLTSEATPDAGAQAVQQALAQPSVSVAPSAAVSPPVAPSVAVAPQPVPVTQGRIVYPHSNATSSKGQPVQAGKVSKAGGAEQGAYKNALAAYQRHKPVEAEQQFESFMAAYPESRLAPNALYWKGECLYLRGKYSDALFVFKDVTTRYPQHPKAADALLKAGMSYARMGDAENAKLHYRVLYEDYPNSQAARKGKEKGLKP